MRISIKVYHNKCSASPICQLRGGGERKKIGSVNNMDVLAQLKLGENCGLSLESLTVIFPFCLKMPVYVVNEYLN